jgi:hypothetical protein
MTSPQRKVEERERVSERLEGERERESRSEEEARERERGRGREGGGSECEGRHRVGPSLTTWR